MSMYQRVSLCLSLCHLCGRVCVCLRETRTSSLRRRTRASSAHDTRLHDRQRVSLSMCASLRVCARTHPDIRCQAPPVHLEIIFCLLFFFSFPCTRVQRCACAIVNSLQVSSVPTCTRRSRLVSKTTSACSKMRKIKSLGTHAYGFLELKFADTVTPIYI